MEVRLTGGTYLPRHSYPAACAIAASMAYDEALRVAGPFVIEPYVGIRLRIENNSLQWKMKTLTALLGEVRAVHSVTDVIRLEVEIPVRLQDAVKSALRLRFLEIFPLPQDQQYRPVTASGSRLYGFSDALDEWT